MDQIKIFNSTNVVNDIDGISEKDSKEENGVDESEDFVDIKK
jgi:hypothetical protein